MKLSDRKTAEGTTRLTDHIIGKMQNQYGEALRNNSNILLYMKNGIWETFYLLLRKEETLKKQHILPQEWMVQILSFKPPVG